jgi:hypothetical protein
VEVTEIRQIADRKQISSSPLNSQVIDFNCVFENFTSGATKGGHYRKGYSRQSVMALLPLFTVIGGANITIDSMKIRGCCSEQHPYYLLY